MKLVKEVVVENFTDHLGSYNVIIDEDKNIVQQSHFDPWGNRKLNTSWSTADATLDFAFDRGFTGHEHYDRFRIINMKARLYDPYGVVGSCVINFRL
jgi:hypothetical protein